MLVRLEAFIISFIAVANAYIWPSPQLDALEAARFDQQGFNANFLAGFIQPCDTFQFGSDTGRANAADWIRTVGFYLAFPHWADLFTEAYHDMATHNSTDGTGGLDASIRFAEEQARVENAGDGFDNTMTLIFLLAIVNRYISISDNIALAALIAIENCGGPEIAFRGGRVDAAVPNAPGVPEPQQDLASHIASFARQGFTQTEMIGLVACGHTFGGVQHDFFPDIVNVLNDTSDTEDVAHFDTTFVTFDNNVALEYISGTTQNPLVVGFNDTTNSDKRIFWQRRERHYAIVRLLIRGANTLSMPCRFANSLDVYASTCANLFVRMLDTVPSNVTLTDVITPLPVKPSNVELILDGNTLQLWGQVRLWNMTEDPTRTVSMLWDNHIGGTGNATLGFAGLSSSTGGKYSAVWYGFNATSPLSFLSLDAIAGVTSLSFVVDNELDDQDGLGFALQDGFMFSQTSCLFGDPVVGKFDVAVRNGVNPTRVYLEQSITDSVQRVSVSEIDIVPPSEPIAANAAYSLWSINITEATTSYGIGAEIDGVKYSTTDTHVMVLFPPCPAEK
ncbi:Peroxidase [Mycena sanguinolenta]|uniref:Peroxidase n=1 Tax=Mycena sanguinolenta TaxID=230812 RepID=A0A8H6XAE6_9AGAR|nr:Peroxidase [Mycena sanguinolenta]